MAEQANKTVDFNTQLQEERAFYLRKTDVIPGSKVTLKEAKENQAKINADFEAQRITRAEKVRDENLKKDEAFRKEKGIENSYTAMVVPGINVQVKNVVPEPLEKVLAQNTNNGLSALPSDAEFDAMSDEDLATLASNRKVDSKASDSRSALIARIKGNYSDARFESLNGKTREILDGYAVELGLGATPDEVKANFGNVELLTAAIEKARK